jgi:hypothetical protein
VTTGLDCVSDFNALHARKHAMRTRPTIRIRRLGSANEDMRELPLLRPAARIPDRSSFTRELRRKS